MSAPHYFTNAHDFHVGSVTIVSSNSGDLEKAFQHLYDNVAADAAHNSAERHDAPQCHEDTRKAVQGDMHSWITDGNDEAEPKRILWLTGPAGTGKTAIAGSIADTCDELGLLAGGFFFASFSGSVARRSKRYLVATLAYYLIFHLDDEHPLRRAVLTAVRRDPLIFQKRLKDQFRFLLIKPFNDTQHQLDLSTLPKVFIIDGLDEVEGANSREPGRDPHEVRLENEADQEEILSALLYAANSSAFPFRIIVASRPERTIQNFLANYAKDVTREIFLDARYDPDSDIRLFLNAKFAEIRRRYRLPSSWPSEKDIEKLLYNASGQFIYAATIVRFLHSGKYPNPKALLASLLDGSCREVGALAPLDTLYMRILGLSPDPLLAVRWIWIIRHLSPAWPALFFNQLLEDYEGHANYLLENLVSLVWIPPVEDQSSPYSFHHKSFLDFLSDENRCGQELNHAYRDEAGSELFLQRSVDIFMNKSPAVTRPESQQTPFLSNFVHDLGVNVYFVFREARFKESVDCDVAWWVHLVASTKSSHTREEGNCECVSDWFGAVHEYCPFDRPGECLPHCKHWRSNILRACKGLGWDVPNDVAFLREALWRAHNERGWFLHDTKRPSDLYFNIGDEKAGSINANLPVTLTRYTVDEGYQASLDLVATMFSHLPPDWRSQLREEVQIDEYAPLNGFVAVIENIRQELGVEAPDVRALKGT